MKFRQWLEFDEIDYGGVARWAQQNWGERIAPNGRPIFENFIRWFGQSKTVDGQDRPKVYHHGAGHDGILGAETVVYEPTQIKALKNDGNFDPDNPDMYQ